MKNRKLLAMLLTVCLAFAALFVLVACEDKNENKPLTGTLTITVGEKDYTVDLAEAKMYEKNSLFDAMEYLCAKDKADSSKKDEDKFSYTGSFSSYGAFINTINGLELAERQYVALFVSDEQYKDTSAYALADKTVGGTTYYYSGVGVSGIKLADGLKVLFVVESY